ncbi:MAG: hypothetical protein EHM15_01890 [Desulfobacteraceae bacterium]|nr:MAG: hypothetical protein EHM15_01890 [Desulfobacteraceae bacterium]
MGSDQEGTHFYRKADFSARGEANGFLGILTMLFLASCLIACGPVRSDLERAHQDFTAQVEPDTFINEMRGFALAKIDHLSEAERQIISSHHPEITTNYHQTQVAFVWRVSMGSYIEVLSTMPPCIPITAFRTNTVKFE